MLQINLPNRDKENRDVDYFKTSNSRFQNALQCSGIAINFIREYLIHYNIKKVCFFNVCGILTFKPLNQELLSAEFKHFFCRFRNTTYNSLLLISATTLTFREFTRHFGPKQLTVSDTFICWWQWLPCKVPPSTSGAIWGLASCPRHIEPATFR